MAKEKVLVKATLHPIGWIKTPYRTLRDCPRNIDPEGPLCELVLNQDFVQGMTGLTVGQKILVLYWFDNVDRDTLLLERKKTGQKRGVFTLRAPDRPNPIAAAVVAIENISKERILVKGLDCLNETPLLDIKPAIFREQANRDGSDLIG